MGAPGLPGALGKASQLYGSGSGGPVSGTKPGA